MGTTPDTEFIRRAVELADLNAVRVALFQHTGDPEIAACRTALAIDDTAAGAAHRARRWRGSRRTPAPRTAARAARGRAARR